MKWQTPAHFEEEPLSVWPTRVPTESRSEPTRSGLMASAPSLWETVPATGAVTHLLSPTAPWPSLAHLLEMHRTGLLNIGRRLRLLWTLRRSRSWRHLVNRALGRRPWVQVTMRRHPVLLRPLFSRFLNTDFNMPERFCAYAHDLEFTAVRLHQAFPQFFQSTTAQVLWNDSAADYHVNLSMNLSSPEEGLWRLSLVAPGGMHVFSLSFSVVRGPRLFVGAVQGGTGGTEHGARDLIHTATKHFEGLRPQFMLFEVLRVFALSWNIESITGVSLRNQTKVRRRWCGPPKIRFRYDAYFLELHATAGVDGNWDVPTISGERNIEKIPSRKRAMYRRRHALLQELRVAVHRRLGFTPVQLLISQ